MKAVALITVLIISFLATRACTTSQNNPSQAIEIDQPTTEKANIPDMIPPLDVKAIDPAAKDRAAKHSPQTFCRALGKALRTDKDPELKRAMIERASMEFASTLTFGQQSAIKAEQLTLGMTPCMAIAAWDRPERINQSVGSYGVHEQWVYPANYLYFENGVITSYQSQN